MRLEMPESGANDQALALENHIAANAHAYPQHHRYLEIAEQITGALALLGHLDAEGVYLARPLPTTGAGLAPGDSPLPQTGGRPRVGRLWLDDALYWDGKVSGAFLLTAFGICYDCLLEERREMTRRAEKEGGGADGHSE